MDGDRWWLSIETGEVGVVEVVCMISGVLLFGGTAFFLMKALLGDFALGRIFGVFGAIGGAIFYMFLYSEASWGGYNPDIVNFVILLGPAIILVGGAALLALLGYAFAPYAEEQDRQDIGF